MQTEEYVETISEKNPENHVEIQTDFYIDRPMNRLFNPKKYGVDTATEMAVGDLFDFDEEVEPLLQVLVYKTLEASRMEVLEEEELEIMKRQLKQFEEKRNYKPKVKIEYVDDTGRVIDPKEAFRKLSHRFHGKGSGKMKQEKRQKKRQEEDMMMRMSSTDTPLNTVAMMKDKLVAESSPYIVLSGAGKTFQTGGGLMAKK